MTRCLRFLTAALAAALLLGPATAAAKEQFLFELTDPRGDDHGDGSLVYPDNDSYAPGELDLVSFAVRPDDGGSWFVLEMARPVRTPDRRPVDALGTSLDSLARHGFYTFNVDVYIDTDRKVGSGGQYTLPGRRVEVAPETAWDRAVVVTPRPFFARSELRRSLMRALRREMRKDEPELTDAQAEAMLQQIPADVERHVFFPHQVKVSGRRVEAFVPDEFLGGKPSPDWAYLVIVTAADLEQSADLSGRLGLTDPGEERLLVQPLAMGRPREAVGGGREGHTLQPVVFDLLAPPGVRQEDLLGDYDQRGKRRAQLPGVVPSRAGE
jgi:hypothetical protein